LRCQFIHSTTLGDLQKEKATSEDNIDIKNYVSYKQMLHDNAQCLTERISSSLNPYLNEFNLIYKECNTRLPIFEKLLAEKEPEVEENMSNQPSKEMQLLMLQYC